MMNANRKFIPAHYFAQPAESRRTSDHLTIDTEDTPELVSSGLNKVAVLANLRVSWVARYGTIRIYILTYF